MTRLLPRLALALLLLSPTALASHPCFPDAGPCDCCHGAECPPQCGAGGATGGAAGGGTGGATTGGTGGAATGGSAGAATGGSSDDGGCSCRVGGQRQDGSPAWLILGLGAMALRRRRARP